MSEDSAAQEDANAAEASVSVFFPCYNEQENVTRVVTEATVVLDELGIDYEILVVNDGSSDNTAQQADALSAKYNAVNIIHHPENRGYGAALQSGFRAATKDLVFYTDGDGQFDMKEFPRLLDLIGECDIVSAFRLNRQDSLIRKINGWFWTKLVCLVFGMGIRDIDCAFKLYRREVIADMPMLSTGALIDAEILARATRGGCRIVQTGVHHFACTSGGQTGANIGVILRAFRELFQLRRRILRGE